MSVTRKLLRAPCAAGLNGAVSGRPVKRTASISMGHRVVAKAVRNRTASPSTGSVSSTVPGGTVMGTCRLGLPVNCTMAAEGTGAR